jgi:hypothetical protein
MQKPLIGFLGIALAGAGCLQAAGLQSSGPIMPPVSQHRTLLNRYCTTCHNEKLKTASLILERLDLENVSERAAVWEKVVRKLRTGAMPPPGAPRPDDLEYGAFASYLEAELDRAAALNPNPGRPGVHRLNRAEYTNAVRDLLAVELDGESLIPADNAGFGFDNVGDALSVSPLLFERYMSAAEQVSRLAIGDATFHPVSKTYEISKLILQDDRMSDELPFGSRGGIAVRHHFPLDGEYLIKIRLQRDIGNNVMGLAEGHQHKLFVDLDGVGVKQFIVQGKEEPKRDSANQAEEDYEKSDRSADQHLEFRISALAGTRSLGVFFQQESSEPTGIFQPSLAGLDFFIRGAKVDPGVSSVEVSGPYNAKGPGNTASRRRIFVCQPNGSEDEEPCARKILGSLARLAYRRPVSAQDVGALMNLYTAERRGSSFESGIGMALRGMLVSPEFLFRSELDPADTAPGTVYQLSEIDLASRLSFFLWSSIPDEELLNLAERRRLKDPVVLEQQVRRMLADSRSKAIVSNFAGQWLYLRNIGSVTPDAAVFSDFNENLREAMQRETELFFGSIVREDRSVLDLLNAKYTFVNQRLARHYGIPNIYGSHFRRVSLADPNRSGLFGKASILTVTSYANRTSPVLRGKWVLENILGAPPPPPPPNVPSLKEKEEDDPVLSMRQRMEQHRANPACASCHKVMDPLGFALENFDGIGRWRYSEADVPIDASGVLPDGTKFHGAAELGKALLSNPEPFVRTLTEKLLTYGLGRGMEHYDVPAIRKIMREAAENNYRWSALILGTVKSTPFQMRRSGD